MKRTRKFNIENAIKNLAFYIEKYKLDIKNLPIFYTVCHSVARSGMSRDIEVFLILENFEWYKTKNKIKYEDLPYQKYFSHRWF